MNVLKIRATIPTSPLRRHPISAYHLGGMMICPGNRIDGKQTINGARGFDGKIGDGFDLTLECSRRHYLGQRSLLGETLARYRDFFALFEDFGLRRILHAAGPGQQEC